MAFVEGGEFDCTGDIGPLYPASGTVTCPMYSFHRPAYALWNAIGRELHAKGWTEEQVRWWFQSKAARHHLDGKLGDTLEGIGMAYAGLVDEQDREWVRNNMKAG